MIDSNALRNEIEDLRTTGFTVNEPSNGHFQITGTVNMVNWWPFSKNRSAHVKAAQESLMCCDLEDVKAMANGLFPPGWAGNFTDESEARIMGPNWKPSVPKAQALAEAKQPKGDAPWR